jgi:hypothetical protein
MQKRAETEMQNRYCVQTDCEKSVLHNRNDKDTKHEDNNSLQCKLQADAVQ